MQASVEASGEVLACFGFMKFRKALYKTFKCFMQLCISDEMETEEVKRQKRQLPWE